MVYLSIIMANFVYTEKDLDRPLTDVIGGLDFNMKDFGLHVQDYQTVQQMDYDIVEEQLVVATETVQAYGLPDVETFLDLYARGHLWNNYEFSTDAKTLRDFLDLYHSKAQKFHPEAVIPTPPPAGNMLDYLKSFDPEWLITVGW